MGKENMQLQQLERQNIQTYLQFFICGILLFTSLACNAEGNKRFNTFIKKFNLIEFTSDFSTLDRGKSILTDEFDLFLNLDSTKWKNTDEYSYFAIASLDLNNFIGLIFERNYESDSQDNIVEEVLCVFDKAGNLKSSLIVGGNYLIEDKEIYIDSDFKSDHSLKINREEYLNGEKSKTETCFYNINLNSGEINKIK